MTIYTTVLDGYGDLTLWRSEGEHDQHPQALAFLTASGNTAVNQGDDHGVVFRAAAAVLAPDEDVVAVVAQALQGDPNTWHRETQQARSEYFAWATAVLAALRAHVEEAKP